MKLLLTIMIAFCCITNATSQTHTFKSGWCRLAKPVKGSVQGEVASFVCQACAKDKETEQKAKATEDKRRADILAAEYKAKKDAEEKTRLENIRLAKEEEKRVKDKAVADKRAEDVMMKKYEETAKNGQINSNLKGEKISESVSIDKIKCFYDDAKKVYGFKIDNIDIRTFPFEGSSTRIYRIGNSNYFETVVYNSNNLYSYSSIIDQFGTKVTVEGETKFIKPFFYKNMFHVNISKANPEKTEYKYCYTSGITNLFTNKEAAVAYLDRYSNKTCFTTQFVHFDIYSVKRYILDANFKLLESASGYILNQK